METKTIVMSYENLEAAVVSFLYQTRTIPESWDVFATDIPLALNDDGFVEFEIAIGKPVKRADLRVVDETYSPKPVQDNQLSLPLEHFETIRVE